MRTALTRPQKKETNIEKITFHLLSLTLFREYVNMEFDSLKVQGCDRRCVAHAFQKGKLKFEYDFERLLDDWILLGFFVGNDFLPHLPHFHMGEVC